jgi:hypothetical protein
MQKAFILMSMLAAGCAGQQVSAPTTVVERVPEGAKELAPKTDDTISEDRLAEAKKMGYKLVNQDGQEFFCRTNLKTGSRVQRETVCVTQQDIDELREQTQQGLANTTRQLPPPVFH